LRKNLEWPNGPHCREFEFTKICDDFACKTVSDKTLISFSKKTQDIIIDRNNTLASTIFYIRLETLNYYASYNVPVEVEIIESAVREYTQPTNETIKNTTNSTPQSSVAVQSRGQKTQGSIIYEILLKKRYEE
jgi:hypothetical protein